MALTERQKALGWREGSSAEFFGLTPAQAAMGSIKLALADKIKATRQAREMTQAQMAKFLKMQQPNVARLELGAERTVSIDTLIHVLLDLGISGEEITATIAKGIRDSVEDTY